MEKYIDATDLILGRMLATVAKEALNGNTVLIVNCEKAYITGSKAVTFAKYRHRRDRGSTFRGPYIPRMPHLFVKRALRGMLPYRQERGKSAFKRVTCHMGVPEELKAKKLESIPKAGISKLPNLKYVSVHDICKFMGAKI